MAEQRQYEDKPGWINLWVNESENAKAPHFKGFGTTDKGVRVNIAAWKKVTSKGAPYLSIRVEEKSDAKAETKAPVRAAPKLVSELDSDIPW